MHLFSNFICLIYTGTKLTKMDYYELLDYLGTLDELDQLVEIERFADLVYSDEFISLIKGHLQFAAKEMAGAGYFEKVYHEEDADLLFDVQTDFREQNKKNKKVWHSMIKLNEGFNFRNSSEYAPKKDRVNHSDEESLFDYDYCIRCGMAGCSSALCCECLFD